MFGSLRLGTIFGGASTPVIVRARGQDAAELVGILVPDDIARAVAMGASDARRRGDATSRDDDASQDRVLS